jgi:hypothetical protein
MRSELLDLGWFSSPSPAHPERIQPKPLELFCGFESTFHPPPAHLIFPFTPDACFIEQDGVAVID